MTRIRKSTPFPNNDRMLLTSMPELIAHKRDGGELVEPEIRWIIERFVKGEVADYQMSALAMAIFFQGMSPRETRALTLAMQQSGRVVRFEKDQGRYVDKHSTGGVGDKISICLAPLVAACGVRVPMVSGRGLGHTGGTLDKLESMPGFSTQMSIERFQAQVDELGCALIGQTADLAPADKRLYALRDVTATVESIPLITASILSKKLAEGIDALVLDVKVGKGAFMKSLADARDLARSLVEVGSLAGKKVTAILTAMDAPLGRAIGNALETREALEILHGGGPEDTRELTLILGAEMLVLGGVAENEEEAREKLIAAIEGGAGVAKMEQIVAAQGGDPKVVREPDRLPKAPRTIQITAERGGYIAGINALSLGLTCVSLGAGRERVDDVIDPSVGLLLQKKPGDRVEKGEVLAEAHVRELSLSLNTRVHNAYEIVAEKPTLAPLVYETVRS